MLTKAKARLKLLLKTQEARAFVQDDSDSRLINSLIGLTNLPKQLPETLENYDKIIGAIKREKIQDENTKIRIDYYQFLKDQAKKSFGFYAKVAEERLDYYKYLSAKKLWESEKEVCRVNSLHWFKYWAWTSDPRQSSFGWAIPFILYPFQEEAVKWLEELIFIKKSSGLIEKSRDMGISWLLISLLYKHWQFSNDNFQALIGSMTIDDVDTVGNPSTLFEKIRIQALLQPKKLLPFQWNRTVPYLKLVNPETTSAIIGESCNERFGRSGRYTVVWFDELSAVQADAEAVTSASQSSTCKLFTSTPRGMSNEFAKLRFSGTIPIKSFHWSQNPSKDQRWYQFQRLELRDESRIAQELDIDYQASVPNRIYTEFDERIHVITHSELIRELPEFGDDDGRFIIPKGHS
ncbi:MAG: hypothetical protein NZL93_06075, partial [Chthoniobacterales bacterium]|nr:hypothetical protein [Chthoniobacterales bacterium]